MMRLRMPCQEALLGDFLWLQALPVPFKSVSPA